MSDRMRWAAKELGCAVAAVTEELGEGWSDEAIVRAAAHVVQRARARVAAPSGVFCAYLEDDGGYLILPAMWIDTDPDEHSEPWPSDVLGNQADGVAFSTDGEWWVLLRSEQAHGALLGPMARHGAHLVVAEGAP